MAFRAIRSSGESSSRATNDQLATQDSLCHSRPERQGENPRRRKVPDNITRNACLNCKQARTKCDGKTPCNRCLTRAEESECTYEIHVRHTKEELVKQFNQSRAKEHLYQQLLQAICLYEDKVPDIIARLKNGETAESIVDWLARLPPGGSEKLPAQGPHYSGFEGEGQGTEESILGGFRWTTVTTNNAVLDHLFQLYFSWVHPVHSLFHEGHFVHSYHTSDRQYCSPVLVNAICAVACHLHIVVESDKVNFTQLAGDFADEVRTNINAEDTSLTTIQAFAVMFLVESARGNALRASAYLKVATGALSRVAGFERKTNEVVWTQTVRGISNTSVEWAQVTFQEPPNIDIETYVQAGDTTADETLWHRYRCESEPVLSWAGYQATTNREKDKLIAIIRDVTIGLYSPRQPKLSAQHILQLYRRLVTWRSDLPSSIGNLNIRTGEPLPHVLSLLILHSSSVVQLLRPLLEVESFPTQHIEDIIWEHAQEGLAILDKQYNTHFTCRYQPVLQMYAVLHLSDVIARYFPGGGEGRGKDGPEAIKIGIDILEESSMGFPVAGAMKEMLMNTARACSIRIKEGEPSLDLLFLTPKKAYKMDDFISACTRPSYVQPVDEIRQRYLVSVSADWLVHGCGYSIAKPASTLPEPGGLTAEEIGARNLMQIRNQLVTR